MKNIIWGVTLSIFTFLFISCKKEYSCKDCNPVNNNSVKNIVQSNKPPIANAGRGLPGFFTPPSTTIFLDGRVSYDPEDSTHISYKWTQISGPGSVVIANDTAVLTQATLFSEGTYQFELKVTNTKGLSDKDTIQVKLLKANVCFYFQDPTGTFPYVTIDFDTPVPNLIIVTINNLSDTLSGVWGNYSPRCPFVSDYNVEPGVSSAAFNLPPGMYKWTAQSSICNLGGYPGITSTFIQYWLSPHSTSGTITVNPGDGCIIQKIVFP